MARRSAGIILYRRRPAGLDVLLGHPGGPLWARRDAAAWSMPKGECVADEDPLAAAFREFEEETGTAPTGTPIPLGEAVQPSRKIVVAYALEGEFDPMALRSNHFEMEWPPRSGRRHSFPELDRVDWFGLRAAGDAILPGQAVFLTRLADRLGP